MTRLSQLPVVTALLLLLVGGGVLLHRSDAQARDTIRKHHLEDIERSLYFVRSLRGTYPPYDAPTWCGQLNDPENHAVRDQVEEALRLQNEDYKNLAKPFPTDPSADQSSADLSFEALAKKEALAKSNQNPDYFYWKRSPAAFELYAILEAAPTGERNTARCEAAPGLVYDYGLNSLEREDRVTNQP